jgi:hypothetical protein
MTTLPPYFIEQESYPEGFDFIDPDCKAVGTLMYERVNALFYPALKSNVIKTLYLYNENFIPIVEYPVLKVYKTTDGDEASLKPYSSTEFAIVYAMAFAQKQKTADISTFVGKEIKTLLKNASNICVFQLDNNRGITINYDTFVNSENVVFKYTTVTCGLLVG